MYESIQRYDGKLKWNRTEKGKGWKEREKEQKKGEEEIKREFVEIYKWMKQIGR